MVTPSYNQAEFLGACIRSVVDQQYPNLEYIVIDGGSSDGSVDIIKSFEKQITYWVSERDNGQYDALNKGFGRATGEILAWLNSDDMYTPWAFGLVAEIFEALPAVEWLSTLYPLFWNRRGLAYHCSVLPGFDRWQVLRHGMGIQQESTFWRRSLWQRSGAHLDTSFRLAADLDLWARFWEHATLCGVTVPLAGIRLHGQQRHVLQRAEYMAEVSAIFARYRSEASSPRLLFRRLCGTMPKFLRRALMRFGFPYRYPSRSSATISGWTGAWTVK